MRNPESRVHDQETQHFYRLLFETAGEAIVVLEQDHDLAWVVADCNASAATLLGVERTVLLGRTMLDFSPSRQPGGHDSEGAIRQKIEAALTGEVQRFEWLYQRVDGETFHAQVALNGFDVEGRVLVQTAFHNITQYRRAAEALKDSEQKFRILFESSPDGIVLIDPHSPTADWAIVDCNETFCRMNGYEREELIGRTIDMLHEGRTEPQERAAFLDRLRGEGHLMVEAVHCHKDGSLFLIESSMSLISLAGREMVLGIDRDASERRRAEAALRQTDLVVQNSQVVLFRWRAAEGWPVEFVSENIAQFGYIPEELLTGVVPYASIVHPDDLERVGQEVQNHSASGTDQFRQEYRIITKDGEVRWTDDRTVIERDSDGNITHYQGIVLDITERKKVEEELAQYRNKLEELVEARTDELENRVRELNELQRLMSREGWQEFQAARAQPAPGYLFDQVAVRPVELTELSIAANGPSQKDSSGDLPARETDGPKAVTKPLTVSGESIGTLGVFDNDPDNRLSPEDQMFLDEVAAQVAEALERARLLEQSQTALAETETLFLAGSRINEAGDLQEVVAAVMEAGAIPAINRAILFAFEQDLTGEVETMTVVANWHSGKGTEPTAIGTRYSKTMLTAFNLLLNAEPLFFDDSQHDERIDLATLAGLQQLNARALAVMPLWVGARHVGSLLLEGEDVHWFSKQDIRLMLSLADQAAVAVDNQRLFAETRQALADVEATQRRYTLQSWEVYRARKTAMSYEQDRDGVPPLGRELPAEVGQAVSQKKSLAFLAAQDLPAGGERGHSLPTEAKSSLVVPLTVRDEIIGVLGLQETVETRAWTPEEIALVEAIAEQVAQAAEQIRLFDETQRRAAREQRVSEIGDKIRAAQSLEEALQVAIKEVGLSLKAPQTTVLLEVN